MPNKTPSIVAALSTFLILIMVGILSIFGQIVLLTKFNWNTIPSVITAVIAATGFGALVSFSSIILSTLFAGIR